MAEFVIIVGAACFALWWANRFLQAVRDRQIEISRRRNSLTHDKETGLYHWVNADGTEQNSDKHPDQPGGDWYEAAREAADTMRS